MNKLEKIAITGMVAGVIATGVGSMLENEFIQVAGIITAYGSLIFETTYVWNRY